MTAGSEIRLIRDPSGQYLPAVCVAIWAGSGEGHVRDGLCARPVDDWFGDIPLCGHHLERVQSRAADYADHLRREVARGRRQAELRSQHVYVVRVHNHSSGFLKVGTTADVWKRIRQLRKSHDRTMRPKAVTQLDMDSMVLLYDIPGGGLDEMGLQRHLEAWHVRGEWFHDVQDSRKAIRGWLAAYLVENDCAAAVQDFTEDPQPVVRWVSDQRMREVCFSA